MRGHSEGGAAAHTHTAAHTLPAARRSSDTRREAAKQPSGPTQRANRAHWVRSSVYALRREGRGGAQRRRVEFCVLSEWVRTLRSRCTPPPRSKARTLKRVKHAEHWRSYRGFFLLEADTPSAAAGLQRARRTMQSSAERGMSRAIFASDRRVSGRQTNA